MDKKTLITKQIVASASQASHIRKNRYPKPLDENEMALWQIGYNVAAYLEINGDHCLQSAVRDVIAMHSNTGLNERLARQAYYFLHHDGCDQPSYENECDHHFSERDY